jgi:hypothetical protein
MVKVNLEKKSLEKIGPQMASAVDPVLTGVVEVARCCK